MQVEQVRVTLKGGSKERNLPSRSRHAIFTFLKHEPKKILCLQLLSQGVLQLLSHRGHSKREWTKWTKYSLPTFKECLTNSMDQLNKKTKTYFILLYI